MSERRACGALKIHRTAYRYEPVKRADEDELKQQIIEYACKYGAYGYRMVTGLVRNKNELFNATKSETEESKPVPNHKRVFRIWQEEGLKVPKKQQKRRRLWLNDGSCIRLRPEYRNQVWSYDFIEDKVGGKKCRWLNVIDEYTRVPLFSEPRRSWRKNAVIEVLANLIITHGAPEYIRSDNGPEFTAKKLIKWLATAGITTMFIEPGSPWENGYCESFNARMRNEFLNREQFDNMYEAQVLTRRWIKEYTTLRPHSSLGYKPPAPESFTPVISLSAS